MKMKQSWPNADFPTIWVLGHEYDCFHYTALSDDGSKFLGSALVGSVQIWPGLQEAGLINAELED